MSNRIGMIVDGEGDFASLRKHFVEGYRILKTDGPRGHTARIADIASRAKKQIGILRAFQCSRVVVVLDFESRTITYNNFVRELRDAFKPYASDVSVDVAVPNRMIENWYLADIEEISRKRAFIRDNLRQKNYEGKHGKEEIKKCMINGVTYSETEHGPQMFATIRFDVAKMNSPSFAEFLNLIQWN